MIDWLTILKNAKKTCIQQGNLRKVHFLLPDGREMVEEYNMETGVVTRRAWKVKTNVGGEGEWHIEVGDPEPTFKTEDILIKENSSQPFVSRRITRKNLEWRIRNLPYSIDVYSVTVDPESRHLIVRTSNRKYFKILNIPELERLNLLAEQNRIQMFHKFNTLVINYEKPKQLIDFEKALFDEVKTIKACKEGDMDCKPS
ncbi:hypothetical protein PPYR_15235 [Photinus pyralis]|uniref:Protein DPCD n=1 Tax=Photinus pyralis TaxID=7054 RepID=A0A1Y1MBW2_PHOPY|nr:protein DPCD [Photinus pyralis]KAB0790403.1 hypothetical protein PPYR_15235 [Photinus pyralis]